MQKLMPDDGIDWTLRRRTIQITLVFSLALIAYLMVYGKGDSSLAQTITDYLMVLIGTTLGGYVFGSAVDNHINGANAAEMNRDSSYNTDQKINQFTKDTKLGTWKQRRRGLLLVMLACGIGIGYLALFAEDTKLHESAAEGLCLLYATALNSWIFGAVYDGYATRKNTLRLLGRD